MVMPVRCGAFEVDLGLRFYRVEEFGIAVVGLGAQLTHRRGKDVLETSYLDQTPCAMDVEICNTIVVVCTS